MRNDSKFPPKSDGRRVSCGARKRADRSDGLSARLDKSLHEPVGSQHLHKSNSVSCQGGEIVAGQSFGLVTLRRGGGAASLQVDALFHAPQRWQRGWRMELLFLFKYGISDLKVWWLETAVIKAIVISGNLRVELLT